MIIIPAGKIREWYTIEALAAGKCIVVNPSVADSISRLGEKCRIIKWDDAGGRLLYASQPTIVKYEASTGAAITAELANKVIVTFDGRGFDNQWQIAQGCLMPLADFEALPLDIRALLTDKTRKSTTFAWEKFDGEKVNE